MEDVVYSMKKEMLRRKYSIRTIKSYMWCIRQFFKRCHKEPQRISKKDVKEYLEELALRNKAGSTINLHLSAIRFMLEETLRKSIRLDFRYSKRPKSLPTVLTKKETRSLFSCIKNKKHKLMIELMYSAGLRLSELLNLKVKDIEESLGWVRKGKGNKDRPFIIAERLKHRVRDYIEKHNLDNSDFVFSGRKGNMHPRTIQEIIRKAAIKAKIRKNVHPHTLRHSFATHLIQDGYDVTDVQSLLGHSNMQTTMVYVHMANPQILSVKSPLDTL